MLKLLFLGFSSVILFSCANIRQPEYRGSEGIKFEKIEGKKISLTAGAKIYNPNWFGMKIKRSNLEVYVEDKFMGKVYLEKKVKLRAKRESSLVFPILLELEDGAMLTVLRYAKAENVTIRFKGKVKAGIFIFSKKLEIDQSRQISGKELRSGMPK